MTFIAYAQNLEDVMLSRVFKEVEKGFYIDVGAQDPIIESVTKTFYDRGWRGINIEPVYQFYQRLRADRPEDINLPIAAGAETGAVPYYEIAGTGLSTLDKEIAAQHAQAGWTVIPRTVSMLPLAAICAQYVTGTIHFLKVDVEGAEQQVLFGMDFQQYRPWVVVVEATLPLSQAENYTQWEDILRHGGYHYVYFDGLSRFYVAREKLAEFKDAFAAPPNCFDEYQRYTEYVLQEEKKQLQQQNLQLTLQNCVLQEELRKYHTKQRGLVAADPPGEGATLQEEIGLLTEQIRTEITRRRG